jgi:hypothetical protein
MLGRLEFFTIFIGLTRIVTDTPALLAAVTKDRQ